MVYPSPAPLFFPKGHYCYNTLVHHVQHTSHLGAVFFGNGMSELHLGQVVAVAVYSLALGA